MLILHTSFITAQYIAGARVLEVALGVPYVWGVASFAVVVGLYTAYGGFRAVAWTDSFQAIVMLVGVLLTAGFGLYRVGGMQALHDGLAAQSPALLTPTGPDAFLPFSAAISFFFVWPIAVAGQPSLITRFLACRDTESLRRAAILIGCYVLLLYPAVIFVGILGRVLVPELAASDHAMPATIVAAVPSALAGLVLAAPMAAIMSTISSSPAGGCRSDRAGSVSAQCARSGQRRTRPRCHARLDRRSRTGWRALRAASSGLLAVHRGLLGNRLGSDVLVPYALGGLLDSHEPQRVHCWNSDRFPILCSAICSLWHAQFLRPRSLRVVAGCVRGGLRTRFAGGNTRAASGARQVFRRRRAWATESAALGQLDNVRILTNGISILTEQNDLGAERR